MSAESPKLSILIPVRDEGVNLKIMLRILRAAVEVPCEILVVHDDVGDDSVPVVSKFREKDPAVSLVHNTIGRGVANAIRAGVDAARGEYALVFAADEAGPVLAIEDMLALMDAGCDLVSCTRYAAGGRRLGGSRIGHFLSKFANGIFHRVGGMGLTDASTGIKMFRRKKFSELSLEAAPKGWAVAFELAIKAQLAGWRLGEVPIVSIDRLFGGKSTFALLPWAREYLRWLLWGMRELGRAGRRGAAVMTPADLSGRGSSSGGK